MVGMREADRHVINFQKAVGVFNYTLLDFPIFSGPTLLRLLAQDLKSEHARQGLSSSSMPWLGIITASYRR